MGSDQGMKKEAGGNGRNWVTFQDSVKEIIARRITEEGRLEYLVNWIGFDSSFETYIWETLEDAVEDFPEMVHRFEATRDQNIIKTKVELFVKAELIKTEEDSQDDQQPSTSAGSKVKDVSGQKAEKIFGVTERNGEMHFIIKWQDKDDADVVPCSRANLLWPEVVIEYYEERLTWTKSYTVNYEECTPESCSVEGEAEKILGMTESDGYIYFLMKWKGTADTAFLPRLEANFHWPQIVIKFHQENIAWNRKCSSEEVEADQEENEDGDRD